MQSVDFSLFIQSLGHQALMAMGLLPHPENGQKSTHMAHAQEIIDVLAMLQTKTQGNLTQTEAKLLETLLYELRMAYLQISKSE